ncbi:MAG: zinc finger protein [Poseidonia sp.]
MFTGTVEARSHEGGLLVHFDGSSPALNAIMVRADDGTYIGKVDGVIGGTDRPLAHVAHIDRSLDMDALIGVSVSVRAKKKPTEQRQDRRQDGRNDRQDGRDNRGYRNDRGGDRQFNDRQGGRGQPTYDDWTCPKCNNSNFARRTVCNRCEEPRPGGGRQRSDRGGRDNRGFRNDRGGDRRFNDRQGGRDNRGGRDNGRSQRGTFNDNDWTCPQCNNSNFSFRNACNRCEAPRPGGGGGGGQRGGGRPSYGGQRNDRRQGGGYRNDRGDRGGDRRSSYGGQRNGGNRGFRDGGRRDGGDRGFRDGGRQDGGDRGQGRTQGGRSDGPRGGRGPQRRGPSDGSFRRAKGKRSGHAHNRPPRDFRAPRSFERKED